MRISGAVGTKSSLWQTASFISHGCVVRRIHRQAGFISKGSGSEERMTKGVLPGPCGASAPPIGTATGACSSQGGVVNRKGGVLFKGYRISFITLLMNWREDIE